MLAALKKGNRAALLAPLRCFGRLEMDDRREREIEVARERFAVMGSGAWFEARRLELERERCSHV